MTVSPLGDLPPTLWFCCPGPVDINIVAKCNACLSGPCKNNGTCSQDPVERYRCACPYGYKVRRETPPLPLRARSALRPADPPSPQGSLGNSMAQVTPEQHLPVALPRYCWGLPSCVILTPLTEDPTDKEEV